MKFVFEDVGFMRFVYLLILQDAAWMILDGRYEGEAIETTSGFQINVVPKGSYIAGLVSILRDKNITQCQLKVQHLLLVNMMN
ncbi:hypothetical protein RyT2_18850 [Pseudolactococcus yaeyamensis]